MNKRPVYLTREGYEALESELTHYKTVRRQQVAERLHLALAEGELIENAELEEARREQSFVEGRIIEIEEKLRHAVLFDKAQNNDKVSLGSHVTVQEESADETELYYVVGSSEASPAEGKISNESPLGRALIGKRVGQNAVVQAPDGDIVFKILEIN